MTGFDIFVLTIIGITTALGLWKGLVIQVFGLGGMILGYIFSARYYEKAAGLLPDINQGTAKITGFFVIFISSIIIAFILGRLLSKLLKIAGLSWINRLLGGALGLVKGSLIITIVVIIVLAFLPPNSDVLKASVTMPYIVSVSKFLGAAIPSDIKSNYRSSLEMLDLLRKSK